jgi:hypothetical protein
MTKVFALAAATSLALALPSLAQKTPPAGKPAPGAGEQPKEGDSNVYKDKEFNFEWTIPPTLKHWKLEVPERKGNARVVLATHAIGDKKELILLKLQAIDAAAVKRSQKELFEQLKADVEDTYAQISKNDVNEKDKFKGESAISAKYNGRNKDERKEIWDRNLWVFKKGGTFYVVLAEAEAGLLDKFKTEIDEVWKGLKIK